MDTTDTADIIVIGAGIAGLSAARTLAEKGKSVMVLEARDRAGGRICTLTDGFSKPVEAGAEFIHGKSPLTKALMKECGMVSFKGEGNAHQVRNGAPHRDEFFSGEWEAMEEKLNELSEDMTMGEFMLKYFSGPQHRELCEDVKRMVQGFDAADMDRISAFSIRDEWSAEEEIPGSRPLGGFGQLIQFLLHALEKKNVPIRYSAVVEKVEWRKGHVVVSTLDGRSFEGSQLLITIPLGVLKAGSIQFSPPLPDINHALKKMEMGGVIKFLYEFDETFWENAGPHSNMKNMAFLFSDAFVPTWWTQKPSALPLLTGWLSGPPVKGLAGGQDSLLKQSFDVLCYLFNCDGRYLETKIRGRTVIDWAHDPFALGAYAYKTVETESALKVITRPVEGTLFFAGEAFHEGEEMGTVEAALGSTSSVVKKILST